MSALGGSFKILLALLMMAFGIDGASFSIGVLLYAQRTAGDRLAMQRSLDGVCHSRSPVPRLERGSSYICIHLSCAMFLIRKRPPGVLPMLHSRGWNATLTFRSWQTTEELLSATLAIASTPNLTAVIGAPLPCCTFCPSPSLASPIRLLTQRY